MQLLQEKERVSYQKQKKENIFRKKIQYKIKEKFKLEKGMIIEKK